MMKGQTLLRYLPVLFIGLLSHAVYAQSNGSQSLNIVVDALAGSCNGAPNGAIAVSASGGTAPYSYAWSNNGSGSAIFNLLSGTYTVTVTDAANNLDSLSVFVPETDSLDVSLVLSKAECAGVDNGVATAIINPPVGTYTYEWNIPGSGNGPQITGLAAGTYVCVTVTETISGCTGTACGVIASHNQVSVDVISTDAGCIGTSNGTATATASQGVPPYTFVWTYPDNSTSTFVDPVTSTITGLSQNIYTVLVTDDRGCTTESAASIGDSCAAMANFSIDIDICDPDSNLVTFDLIDESTLTDSSCSIVSWVWFVAWSNGFETFQGQTPPSLTLPALESGIVTLQVTTSSGCVDSIGLPFTLPEPISINLNVTGDTIVCHGDSITLVASGNPNNTYVWTPQDGLTISPDGTTAIANPDSTTTYYVMAENNGCPAMDSVTVIRPPQVMIDLPGGVLETCLDSVTFNLVPNGTFDVTWYDENGNELGTTITITVPANDTTSYVVVGVDANGCVSSDTAVLIGNGVDIDLDIMGPVVLCADSSITLTVINNDPLDTLTYTWFPLDGLVVSPDGTTAVANPDTTTTYYVVGESNGCTDTAFVTIVRPPQVQIDLPGSTQVTCLDSVTLSLVPNGTFDVIWYDANGNPIGDTIWLTIPANDTSTYIVVGIDSLGCTSSDTAVVIGIGVDIDVVVPDPALLCADSLLTLEAINNNPGDILTYNWSANDPSIDIMNPTSPTPTVKGPAGNWIITLIVSNQNMCTDTIDIPIEFGTPDSLAGYIDIDFCDGLVVGFTNNSPYDGVWDFGNGQTSTANDTVIVYEEAGIYTITFDTDAACVEDFETEIEVLDTIAVIADFDAELVQCGDTAVWLFNNMSFHVNPATYQWIFDPAGNPASSTDENPEIVFYTEDSVSITLIITDINGCSDTLTKTIEVNLVLDEIDDNAFCPGDSVHLNPVFNSEYTYEWSSDPVDPNLDTDAPDPVVLPMELTTYFVTITHGDCVVLDTAVITPKEAANVEAVPDTFTCNDQLVTVEALGGNIVSYQWSNVSDFSNIIGEEQSIQVTPLPNGVYYVRITNEDGCEAMDSVLVENKQVNIAYDGEKTLCSFATIQLEIENLNPEDTLTYTWTPSLPGVKNPMVNPQVTTTYTAVVENQFGCVDTAFITVQVAVITVDLSLDGGLDKLCIGDTLGLIAVANGGTEYTYFWEPIDKILDPADGPSVLAVPDGPTVFYVTAVDQLTECFATDSISIDAVECRCDSPFVYVPTAFTPNGDGSNDYLIARTTEVTELHFMVFSRWGEKVYETFDINHTGWDGRIRGKEASPDSYGWYLVVVCDGVERKFKGDVTLLR
jgi:gliding motility-associated-like protein